MKIGIYDPYLDDLGGGEKYMMTIAECLSKDNDVSVFWDNPKDLAPLTSRFSLDLTKVKVVTNIFSKKTSFVTRLQKSKEYDAIILLSDGSIPLLSSKKLFVHIQQPLKQFEKGSIKNSLKLSRVTKFFCNSEYTRSFINKKFDLQTVVVYPPLEAKPKDIKKENIILHVGRFRVMNVGVSDYKKQQVMIDAFKHMINQGLKKWELVIATSVKEDDKDEFERVKNSAKEYPITFLVNKTNYELWDIYSRAKIYWHASGYGEDLWTHPEFAEHFGISTIEAMSAGCVPVVINAGGQKEIVENGENGYLWDDLSELEKQTLHLIENPELLGKMGKNARIVIDRFSKEKFNQQIRALIQ